MTNIKSKSMRLDQDQLDRLGTVLNYFGLGKDDTATIKTALNNLENVLQGQFTMNLIDSINLVRANNKQLKTFKKDVSQLKRNTN